MVNFIIGYYVVSAIYLAITMKRRLRDGWYTLILVTCLPFFGLLFSLLQDAAAFMKTKGGDDRFKELTDMNVQEDRIYQRVNVDKETNLLPLEEALVVNDNTTRRRLLLDILKEDMDEKMIPLLEQAVNNEDTETSHYAVTAVMEIKRKLLLSIQKWSVRHEDDKENPQVLLAYANAIKNYSTSGFMDKRTQMTYKLTYVNLLRQLLQTDAASVMLYQEIIESEKALERYDEALRNCDQFLEKYPQSEQAYLSALDLYYTLKMREPFYAILEDLKASKISVSNRGLNIIRFWSVKGA
ncbi:hypothetical protein [Paenibacillus sp. CF384]|uniref:hypothetical protein n=1 Tax=Paenibacillus sp. CF384 TaxID=1884382 RepID=UPI00089AB059|nr:hypothetical protein [Paenibacillus sp. CF384]SDW66316.1 hypothetical protein SAMN05518855_100450 [Paenibacillus sp. CF384]